jgi:hypothetical protein
MAKMALSWSRISDYRLCPAKFKKKYIEKLPNFQLKDEDKSPHLVRGGNVHKQLEKYVIQKLCGEVPEPTMPEVIKTAPLIDKIMENYNVLPENQIAIDEYFNRVSWYDKNAYFRVIYDLIGFGKDLLLGDYKTGKFADYSGSLDEMGQLHMAGVVGMALWPEYDECSSLYIYVDHRRTVPCTFSRKDSFDRMKENLIKEHENINSDEDFLEKKNKYCGWCEATHEQCKNKR